MDSQIIASIIGALGTIGAAVITVVYSKSQGFDISRARRLALFYGAVIVIAFLIGGLIAAVLYDPTERRIRNALPDRTGYRQVVYPRTGMGLSIPNHWHVDDASFRFCSGDIDLIRDYDPNAASISQGIKIRFLNVQETYVNNPEAEINNQLEVLSKIDPDVTVKAITLVGLQGNRFFYKQSTGQRTGHIQMTWVRLANRVKIAVISFSNLDKDTRKIFEKERNEVISSFVLDKKHIEELAC